MPTLSAATNTLASHFQTQMATLQPDVRVIYENDGHASGSIDPKTKQWVRYMVNPGLVRGAALGPKLLRGIGVVVVQVFTPLGTGQGPGHGICQSIQDMFLEQTISGVWIRSVQWQAIGESGGFYMHTVTVRFQADEQLTA